MNFEFASAGRIVFGRGSSLEAVKACRAYGSSALVITGASPKRHQGLIDALKAAVEKVKVVSLESEPTVEDIEHALEMARSRQAEMVIGLGGGSAVDAAKAVGGLFHEEDWLDCLEVVGSGRPLSGKPLPVVAIPTTAGTGAEVTRNAVIKVEDVGVKVSVRHPNLLPDVAVIDPELSASMPPAVTAATGMDALIQLLEAFTSRNANPVTDSLCREGLERAGRSLRNAYQNGADLDAREDMALAAMLSGLALANAKLGAVHGIAGPLGGMIKAAHGSICAALAPAVVRVNVKAMTIRDSANAALEKYEQAKSILAGKGKAASVAGWLDDLRKDLRIPGLAWQGLEANRTLPLAQAALRASSMRGNPVDLTEEEVVEAIKASR